MCQQKFSLFVDVVFETLDEITKTLLFLSVSQIPVYETLVPVMAPDLASFYTCSQWNIYDLHFFFFSVISFCKTLRSLPPVYEATVHSTFLTTL